YLEKYVYGVKGQEELIALVGEERIETIKADPHTGYAVNMKRN
ncbi:MAG: CoA transferase subunit A, partial [Deltaproteobacteria bacterium]|nr:CoA transferase subunit A [Deltaproteobacteria bacterium]